MKKYLPSLDEIVPGAIIVIVALALWQVVGPAITSLTAKLPKIPSAS